MSDRVHDPHPVTGLLRDMNATTPQQKNESVVEPVTLPLIAFEDGTGDLTVHFEADHTNPNESLVGFKLAKAGFVDTFEELLDVDAFEPQTIVTGPMPVTVATLTVHPDGIEKVVANGEYLTDEGVERFKKSALNTVVR